MNFILGIPPKPLWARTLTDVSAWIFRGLLKPLMTFSPAAPLYSALSCSISLPFHHPPTPARLLVHCSTGNNRTGVLIGVLLSLVNVSPSNIVAEYALSDVVLAPSRPAVVARLAKNPVFARAGGGGYRPAREDGGSASREYACDVENIG
jgi:hypothetical protein